MHINVIRNGNKMMTTYFHKPPHFLINSNFRVLFSSVAAAVLLKKERENKKISLNWFAWCNFNVSCVASEMRAIRGNEEEEEEKGREIDNKASEILTRKNVIVEPPCRVP